MAFGRLAPQDTRVAKFKRVAQELMDEYGPEIKDLVLKEIRAGGKDGFKYLELVAHYESGKPVETVELRPRQVIQLGFASPPPALAEGNPALPPGLAEADWETQ